MVLCTRHITMPFVFYSFSAYFTYLYVKFTYFFVKRLHTFLLCHNKKQSNMNKNSFIVSDETKNSFGMVIKTDGIDIEAFIKNPVMLYMHERKSVVGRWENLRKEGTKLIADAVFDDTTELGKSVKAQVEKGFLRSASIGIQIIEEQDINGVRTVTKSILNEISIVDIPSNKNALKLCNIGGNRYLRLQMPQKIKSLRKELISMLELDESATDEDIINAIQELLNIPDKATTDVENAIMNGFINEEDRYNFINMARLSPSTFSRYISGEKKKNEKTVNEAVNRAFNEGRIRYAQQKEIYRKIGLKMGFSVLSELINTANIVKPTDIIKLSRKTTTGNEEKIIPDDPFERLMYYRKYNPEYLKEHPEEFEQLLKAIK